jgi:small conductance mechanosensitive channel
VKDLITGLFILMEDSIHVGDVVRVGGHVGVVESLTVRTVRLRDLQGTVHTVPFSSVDTIENLTKDFSYALIDIGVAYREDYDHVVTLLTHVAEEMAEDSKMAANIMEPLEVMGLNELADSAVVIRVRFKTPPLKQWAVRRDFLRRVKKRFDEEGVEMPFPHATLYFGADRDGAAAPLLHREAPPADARPTALNDKP